METIKLVAYRRQETGKGPARRLRRAGKLPAVLYGRGLTEAVTVDDKALAVIRHAEGGANAIIDLVLDGNEADVCQVILREVQIDPVSRARVHADFYRVAMDEPIGVTVPLEFVNEPENRLKAAQVMLSIMLRDLEVECLPRDIPTTISVDLQDLEVGDVVHAGTLPLPPNVTLVTDAEEAVVTTVTMEMEMEEAEAEGADAAAAEDEDASED
jgi:large subunit ribosomal protein L25